MQVKNKKQLVPLWHSGQRGCFHTTEINGSNPATANDNNIERQKYRK